jgi:hypothetical protein
MKALLIIISLTLLGGCLSRLYTPKSERTANQPALIQVAFEDLDADGDGNLSKAEYSADAETVNFDAPGEALLGILIITSLIVCILAYATKCWRSNA